MMMRLFSTIFVVTALLCTLSATAFSQTIDTAKIAHARKYIDASNAKWCEAHRTADPKLLASLFVDKGALLTRNGRMTAGLADIEALFTNSFKQNGPSDMTITSLEVWALDSLAYEYGRFTMKAINPPDGDTTTVTGMYFEIWQQLPDGSYKILRDASVNPNKQP